MKKLLIMMIGLASLSSGIARADEVRERTTYFMVKGSSFDEISNALGLQGPVVDNDGARHAGATNVSFSTHPKLSSKGGPCKVVRPNVRLDLLVTLPRWTPPRGAQAGTKVLWKTLYDDIVRHEKHHTMIARKWLQRLEHTVDAMGPERDCAVLQTKIDAVTQRMLAEHDREQIAFDAAEAKRIDSRLVRALQENKKRVAAR